MNLSNFSQFSKQPYFLRLAAWLQGFRSLDLGKLAVPKLAARSIILI
jgi:hypothetical protein